MVDLSHLRRAVDLAAHALQRGILPVGAVLTAPDGRVLGEVSRPEGLLDHAELVLLRQTEAWLKAHPYQAVLYSSLEPCLMCLGAVLNAKVGRVIYAVRDGEREYHSVLNATGYLRYRAGQFAVEAEPCPASRERMRNLLSRYWTEVGHPEKAGAFLEGGRHWAS